MIPKIGTGRGGTRRLLAYLYGPGRHNEHTDQHTVASWNGFAPDPRHGTPGFAGDLTALARQLDQPVTALGEDAPKTTVWHCSLRAAPEDPILTDEQWATIARRVLSATGIAPTGDQEACRWVAVRHAPDHIHIAATLVRRDGRPARLSMDRRKAQAECRRVEADYGLRRLNPGDGTAAPRPTGREHFKARRRGHTATSRELLRARVRKAAAVAGDEEQFFALLTDLGARVEKRHAPSGDVLGYKVALPGDTNADGRPIWYSGSTLSPDLSLPRPARRPATARRPDPWHRATAAVDRVPAHLTHGTDEAAAGQLHALGNLLDTLPHTAPDHLRHQLQQAADAFERATRSRIRVDHDSAAALRRAGRQLLHQPTDTDGTGLAMLLDAVLFAVVLAHHWHSRRHHAQQEAAAREAFRHIHTAHRAAAERPLRTLAAAAPPAPTTARYAHHIRHSLPEHADRILRDPAWPALTATIAAAEHAGHNPAELLDHAIRQRPLTDADNPARVLTWRLHRLGHRTPPSTRALAARTRRPLARPTAEKPAATPGVPPTTVTPRRGR